MAIAQSGVAINWNGPIIVACTGGDSLIEMNQDGIGFVPVNGADTPAGVITAETAFQAVFSECELRFTGAGTVSYRGPTP